MAGFCLSRSTTIQCLNDASEAWLSRVIRVRETCQPNLQLRRAQLAQPRCCLSYGFYGNDDITALASGARHLGEGATNHEQANWGVDEISVDHGPDMEHQIGAQDSMFHSSRHGTIIAVFPTVLDGRLQRGGLAAKLSALELAKSEAAPRAKLEKRLGAVGSGIIRRRDRQCQAHLRHLPNET